MKETSFGPWDYGKTTSTNFFSSTNSFQAEQPPSKNKQKLKKPSIKSRPPKEICKQKTVRTSKENELPNSTSLKAIPFHILTIPTQEKKFRVSSAVSLSTKNIQIPQKILTLPNESSPRIRSAKRILNASLSRRIFHRRPASQKNIPLIEQKNQEKTSEKNIFLMKDKSN